MQKQDQFRLQGCGERSMLTTWKISYDQVLRRCEAAAWLLRLWAFFYHDDLWYGLLAASTWRLANGTETPTWFTKLAGSSLEFSSAMGLLKAYSLADSQEGGSYSMHSVLHQWSRSLSLHSDAASLLSISVCVLGNAAPSEDDKEYWKLDRRLLQHALHSSDEMRRPQMLSQHEPPPWAMHCLGDTLSRQGKLEEAEQMYQRALLSYQCIYGPSHERVTATSKKLASTRSKKGKLPHLLSS